jgi:hypothetical protein
MADDVVDMAAMFEAKMGFSAEDVPLDDDTAIKLPYALSRNHAQRIWHDGR